MNNFTQIPSPCFVLQEKKFLDNLAIINDVQDKSSATIIFALKAFADKYIFSKYSNHIGGAASSSINETKLAYHAFKKKCHVYSPAYSKKELEKILPMASYLTFNSFNQFERYKTLSSEFPDVSIGIRINPGFSTVETDMYNPCSEGSRLGVPLDLLPQKIPKEIEGIHLHNLCEGNFSSLQSTLKILENKIPHLLKEIQWINLGGGHAITHSHYKRDELIDYLIKLREKYSLDIILEPGAAFMWQTGFLKTQILDIVSSSLIQTAILNISFSAHLPDCLEMPYLPEIEGASIKEGNHQYRLGGNTCLAGDFIGNYFFEQPLKIGDYLIFRDMMHYTMVKSNHFNGVSHPPFGLLKTDGSFEIVNSFQHNSIQNQIP